jgi:Resolvase, N terminal domain
VSRILRFEKLVALFLRKSNEIPELLECVMQVGYACVSTRDQHLTLQRDALRKVGCLQIYEEVVSGARAERPVLQQTLAHLRAGDVRAARQRPGGGGGGGGGRSRRDGAKRPFEFPLRAGLRLPLERGSALTFSSHRKPPECCHVVRIIAAARRMNALRLEV